MIRPLLTVSRSEVERYCREHDLQPRFDTSNLDTTFFRNRLRHELLPLLETYNPNIREVLLRTAEVIAAEVEMLRDATGGAWRATLTSESDSAMTFDLGAWRDLPLAMRRATLREAIRRLRPSLRNINFVHVENAVVQLQHGPTGVRVTLPQGLMLTIGYQSFTITASAHVIDLPDWPLLSDGARLTLTVPGTIQLSASDWLLETTCLDRWSDQVFVNSDPWTAYLDANLAGPGLSIRVRQAGDVFHPQGMPTPARLTDWMTNAKIPQQVRDLLPLIIAGDRIAWVAGFRVGQPFIITPNTRRVLKLSFRRLADSPDSLTRSPTWKLPHLSPPPPRPARSTKAMS